VEKKMNELLNNESKLNEKPNFIDEILSNLSNYSLPNETQIKLIKSLTGIIKNERRWDKNSEHSAKELMNSEDKHMTFYNHEMLIKEAFGEIKPFTTLVINEEFVDVIAKYLNSVKTITYKELHNRSDDILYVSDFADKNTYDELDKNLVLFDIEINDIIIKLHQVFREKLSEYLKSPFSFVNTRAWLTKPGSNKFGPNSIHRDGFSPGHVKLMIYLTPLNENYGQFNLAGNIITNQPVGTCIAFRNSDIDHSGIPGEKFPRICIEITLFRTLVNCNQFHNGHPNGRHYLDVSTPYLKKLQSLN
jgi:hypothetical protein